MNSARIKLFLAFLWLVPGAGLLVHDLWSGDTIALPIGGWRAPLWLPFLIMAGFNGLRWWAERSHARTSPGQLIGRRPRRSEAEPDTPFRFDEPPPSNPAGPNG